MGAAGRSLGHEYTATSPVNRRTAIATMIEGGSAVRRGPYVTLPDASLRFRAGPVSSRNKRNSPPSAFQFSILFVCALCTTNPVASRSLPQRIQDGNDRHAEGV